jgi:hypothetical protein
MLTFAQYCIGSSKVLLNWAAIWVMSTTGAMFLLVLHMVKQRMLDQLFVLREMTVCTLESVRHHTCIHEVRHSWSRSTAARYKCLTTYVLQLCATASISTMMIFTLGLTYNSFRSQIVKTSNGAFFFVFIAAYSWVWSLLVFSFYAPIAIAMHNRSDL